MRLKQRKNVDLPQPDGPMNAVTSISLISILISKRAWESPYAKSKLRISMIDDCSLVEDLLV